jgi:hypothetical protein
MSISTSEQTSLPESSGNDSLVNVPPFQLGNQTVIPEVQVLEDELDPAISYLSPVFTSTLPYLSQTPFTILVPDPDNPGKNKNVEGALFDFYSYLVNDAFIPRFLLQGYPLQAYDGDILPAVVNEISAEIYLQYQEYLDLLHIIGVGFYNPGEPPISFVRTIDRSSIDPIQPVVVQYIQKGYTQKGDTVIAFLYKFLNSNLEISDYVYGSYIYDQDGNLKNIEVYKYSSDLIDVIKYSLNIQKTENGYIAQYQIGSDITKKIAIENYQENDFNGNGFSDARFDVVGYTNGKPKEAYHLELDDYSPGLGGYLGVFQVKVRGINNINQIGFIYTRYLPEDNATVVLEYPGLADPRDDENKFNNPEITYIKNTSSGQLQLNFQSPSPILREDMDTNLGDKILEIFNTYRDEIDYSIKYAEENSVYGFLSFIDDNGERKNLLNYYEATPTSAGIKEIAHTYSVDSTSAVEFNFSLSFKEDAKRFIQTHSDKVIAETRYNISVEGDVIQIEKESFAEKEDGSKEWHTYAVSINDENSEIRQALTYDASILDTILSSEKVASILTHKSDYLLRVDKFGNAIFVSGYAMRKNENGGWMPESPNVIISNLTNLAGKAGVEINPGVLDKIDDETVGIMQDGSKLTQLKIFGVRDQEQFSQYEKPWLFKIYEFSIENLQAPEKIGAGEITGDGKVLKPLFYLKPIDETRFEVEHNLEIEAPLLYELLRYTGKIAEFERGEEVEISLMQEVYDIWDSLGLGKAGSSSLLNQIEDSWPGYVELLVNEGKRVGFEIETVQTVNRGEADSK